MTRRVRGIACSAIAALLGASALWVTTDGGRAFTSETAGRVALLHAPRALPDVELEDANGRPFRLRDYRGRMVAVEFIYTRCVTTCSLLASAFRQIHDQIPSEALGRDIVLLTISFDDEHDDLANLQAYGRRVGADGETWRLSRVVRSPELPRLLRAFGVVVISDGRDGFEHNAALHLVGRDGKLREIRDLDDVAGFVKEVRASL